MRKGNTYQIVSKKQVQESVQVFYIVILRRIPETQSYKNININMGKNIYKDKEKIQYTLNGIFIYNQFIFRIN